MGFDQFSMPDHDVLNRLAALTGVGWTGSVLAYLGVTVGDGTEFLAHVVGYPELLLYLGAVFFVASLYLDHLVESHPETER